MIDFHSVTGCENLDGEAAAVDVAVRLKLYVDSTSHY